MTPEDKELLLDDIENEGFDYALTGYRDWSFIDDPVFQEKLKLYVDARTDLAEYIGVIAS